MDIQKLTKEQAVIISGFTGILCGEFSDFHADVEKRLGRGVQTFEFGFKEFSAEVKRLYEADFIEMGTVSKEEAKAQAVPEWAVIVPRLSANYLFNKVPELGFKHQDEKDTVLYHLNYMASGFKESAKQLVEDNHAKQKAMIEAAQEN